MAVWTILVLWLLVEVLGTNGEAMILDSNSLQQYRVSKKLILINFYADWCRYSAALKPIYDKAADQIASETNDAILTKVDCENNKPFCQHEFHISKYPTIKIIRNGELIRKEYRGQRTLEALVQFVHKQIEEPVEMVPNYAAIFDKVEGNVKAAIGFFHSNTSAEYQVYSKVAFSLKDECKFFAIINGNSDGNLQITFREHGSPDQQYNGDLVSYDSIRNWLAEHCIPLVREITFQNGEELTEEGLPFLILFYHPEQTEVKAVFRRRVEEELINHKGSVNFVTADGIKFAHPLSHLGKSKKDLPVLAIDSFRHMYIFPNFDDIHEKGKLKQFIEDLHSGKLHREFHYGPGGHHHGGQQHQPSQQPQDHEKKAADGGPPQQPPESTFKKLQPAKSRYSLLEHDEL